MESSEARVSVVGAGLAGCECALQLAKRGVKVKLYEMRPQVMTPAHKTDMFAELVCSNSFKSTKEDSAAGLLKNELAKLGSMVLLCAQENSVPAGGALAVDRNKFSLAVGNLIANQPNIEVVRSQVTKIPEEGCVVIAAGPLCSEALFEDIGKYVSGNLSFFDAAAPIVDAASLDYGKVFAQSRYDKGSGDDYLNCPMTKEEYDLFMDELVKADRVILHDFERAELFQACQPVEEVARTGHDALRFGALKPVGIVDPRTGKRPWAVVQLRAENCELTAYNLVGFQTNLTFSEQKRVFGLIPGLENADYFRYGVMHRNSFIDSPRSLDATFALKDDPRVRFAGQITGTEGYTEAIATGLFAAMQTYAYLSGNVLDALPATSALGSLLRYATSPDTVNYQPMHVNFGLVPALDTPKRMQKKDRYAAYASRAKSDLDAWIAANAQVAGIEA